VVDVDQHANPANAYFPNPANDSNLVTRSPSNNAQIIKSSIRVDGTTLKALPVVDESSSETYYNLTFNVDCLVDVDVKIYYNAKNIIIKKYLEEKDYLKNNKKSKKNNRPEIRSNLLFLCVNQI